MEHIIHMLNMLHDGGTDHSHNHTGLLHLYLNLPELIMRIYAAVLHLIFMGFKLFLWFLFQEKKSCVVFCIYVYIWGSTSLQHLSP